MEGSRIEQLNGISDWPLFNRHCQPPHRHSGVDKRPRHPFADEGHILSWLAIAADIYRKSTLPRSVGPWEGGPRVRKPRNKNEKSWKKNISDVEEMS
jgi:hypothetical protein